MRYFIPVVLAGLVLVSIPAVQAQSLPAAGARVRITTFRIPLDRTVGAYERRVGDTVVVAGRRISLASISLFEVSAGRKSRWLAGMGLGLLAGGGIGAIGMAVKCSGDAPEGWTGLDCAAAGGAFFGAIGLTVGALIGAFARTERWNSVPLGRLHLTMEPGPSQQVRLAFAVPF